MSDFLSPDAFLAYLANLNKPKEEEQASTAAKDTGGEKTPTEAEANPVSQEASQHEKSASKSSTGGTDLPEVGPSPGEEASDKGKEAKEVLSRATSSHGSQEKAPKPKAADPWALIDPFPKREKLAEDD
ncbi:MAG: hypothetical protein Q9183_007330, partial [Haloplaca sp. 2 TL-2023]